MFCSCNTFFMALASLVAIIVASFISPWARYHVKMALYIFAFWFTCNFLEHPLFLLRPRDFRNGFLCAWGLRTFTSVIGNSFEIRGIQNINTKTGGVVVINHQSALDMSVLAHLWPVIGNLRIVTKSAVQYILPLSAFNGALFINRSDQQGSVSKLNKVAKDIQQIATKLIMFPEGTRHEGNRLLPFKKGPFHIAIDSQSMIQPVVVSRYTFLDSRKKIFGKGHSIISVLPEIDCRGMTKENVPALLERTQRIMQEEFDRISKIAGQQH